MTEPAIGRQPALQDRFSPQSCCFGCGPANPQGLQIKSHVAEDGTTLVAHFRPREHHQAFPGVVNGGILGTLLDCHSNWAATWTLMRRAGASTPPCTVTAEFHVKLRRPTPLDADLELRAWPVEVNEPGDRAVIEAILTSGGHVTASCRGVFVAVKPGHPGYHRW
jgi:acyl-coenzyme A thioesterase PaaI-like protein